MRISACVLCLLAALLAGGCQSLDELDQDRAGIIGGNTTTDWDAVVLVFDNGFNTGCSGVQVAPDVILTAGHCLDGATPPVTVLWLDDMNDQPDEQQQSSEIYVHPDFDLQMGTGNLGVVILPQAASATPIPLNNTAPDTSWIGPKTTPLRMVGFGPTSCNGNDTGIKREADEVYDSFSDDSILYEDATNGFSSLDGGGPVLTDRSGSWEVAGIIAAGSQDCLEFGMAQRVDTATTWIESYGATGDDDDDTADDDTGDDDTADDDAADDDAADDDAADDDAAGDDDDADDDDDDDGGAGDCSCHTGQSGLPGAPMALLVGAMGLLVLRRRV